MSQTTVAPLAPMAPDAVISAFTYLWAVQADDTQAAGELAAAELLVDVAVQIVVPVTALPCPDTGEACEDVFALEAPGRVFITTPRTWEQAGPDAAEGITRRRDRFHCGDPHREPRDVADILRQLEAVAVGQALNAHRAPAGAHPVRFTVV